MDDAGVRSRIVAFAGRVASTVLKVVVASSESLVVASDQKGLLGRDRLGSSYAQFTFEKAIPWRFGCRQQQAAAECESFV